MSFILLDEIFIITRIIADRRWDADFRTVQSLLDQNALGRIVEFESHFDTHSPLPRHGWQDTWRTEKGTGSGVLYDLGSHLIDQTVLLFGLPKAVTSFLYHQRCNEAAHGDPDSMTILLHYASGMFANLRASVFNVEERKLRFWIRGENGTYIKVSGTPSPSRDLSGITIADRSIALS